MKVRNINNAVKSIKKCLIQAKRCSIRLRVHSSNQCPILQWYSKTGLLLQDFKKNILVLFGCPAYLIDHNQLLFPYSPISCCKFEPSFFKGLCFGDAAYRNDIILGSIIN